MSLSANKSDYLRAFDKHYRAYRDWKETGHKDTKSMVIFYCVECGLKYLYMHHLRIYRVKDANEEISSILNSHNLLEILKELRMSKYSFPCIKTSHNENVSLKEYHQMRRYCIEAKTPKDYKLIDDYDKNLYSIVQWINEERQGL